MNPALLYYRLVNVVKTIFWFTIFQVIQKPLWLLSYNKNGNHFKCQGRLYNCKIVITGGGNSLIIRRKVALNNVTINILGTNNKLIIEENTLWTESGRIRIEDNGNLIQIGKNCDFRGCFFACGDFNTQIRIGNDCLFSANVIIRTSDSHSILNTNNERINQGKSISIGNHVWIGNGANILKGSTIGNGCIIGTQTVISGKYFGDENIVCGNPGRIVKSKVNWIKERIR